MSENAVIQGVFGRSTGLEHVAFKSFIEPGREGVDVFTLYGPDDTGPDGPEASILRFAPGAYGTRHRHPGFELILVLDGVLEDETEAKYGAGTLIVMSPGSIHTPQSSSGCAVLVVREKPVEPLAKESPVSDVLVSRA